ncbi:hypothetical protein B0G76_2014 [Paraburkholderia sp. BL23I1N1]|nr:hypothetical protein B0G76_2014 [Paraburkholderia sp. BL23I1N1]
MLGCAFLSARDSGSYAARFTYLARHAIQSLRIGVSAMR